jgi:hypothetical protein
VKRIEDREGGSGEVWMEERRTREEDDDEGLIGVEVVGVGVVVLGMV